jgi:hypothetical protein
MNAYRLLADLIVVVHVLYVGFVLFGLAAILVGVVLRWRWVRNFWFRIVHFLMIGLVVAESLCGIECPLTTWEAALRKAIGEDVEEGSFIGRWLHELMFYPYGTVPEYIFTMCYCLFAAAVLATLLLAPPRLPARLAKHFPTFDRRSLPREP